MSHRYDEFYRLLVDGHVVFARAVREAEKLNLSSTLDELRSLYNGIVKVANNVMTKIEGDHIAGLIDAHEARQKPKEPYAQAAESFAGSSYKSVRVAIAEHDTIIGVTPQVMYQIIEGEKRDTHCSNPTAAEGHPACPAAGGATAADQTTNQGE